jgi:hypothetical protein
MGCPRSIGGSTNLPVAIGFELARPFASHEAVTVRTDPRPGPSIRALAYADIPKAGSATVLGLGPMSARIA